MDCPVYTGDVGQKPQFARRVIDVSPPTGILVVARQQTVEGIRSMWDRCRTAG